MYISFSIPFYKMKQIFNYKIKIFIILPTFIKDHFPIFKLKLVKFQSCEASLINNIKAQQFFKK
ncbi:hypothetical protein GLYMA_19G095551v4 [Glycine max]|nr:hypothetical protein GLYMA_19G095551v4 [Glycine max]KAH1077084.1 hypothetical protein GYH30_052551 [Glycine max]